MGIPCIFKMKKGNSKNNMGIKKLINGDNILLIVIPCNAMDDSFKCSKKLQSK